MCFPFCNLSLLSNGWCSTAHDAVHGIKTKSILSISDPNFLNQLSKFFDLKFLNSLSNKKWSKNSKDQNKVYSHQDNKHGQIVSEKKKSTRYDSGSGKVNCTYSIKLCRFTLYRFFYFLFYKQLVLSFVLFEIYKFFWNYF